MTFGRQLLETDAPCAKVPNAHRLDQEKNMKKNRSLIRKKDNRDAELDNGLYDLDL